MLEVLAKSAKQIVLVGIVLTALVVLGNVVATYVAWSWLTNFFIIVRKTVGLVDFMIDTDTLFTIIGYSFLIQIGVWIYRATTTIVNFFNER